MPAMRKPRGCCLVDRAPSGLGAAAAGEEPRPKCPSQIINLTIC
jgi:hypothetical protein